MGTTMTPGKVATDATADALTKQLLDGRELLPKAANNRAPLPRDPSVAHTRHGMRYGKCLPFHHLLAVVRADLEDGVPFSTVIAPFRQLQHAIEVMAVDACHERAERPIPAVCRQETKAQARLDLAQLRVVESPESQEALADVLAEAAGYQTVLEELTTTVSRRLAVVRTHRVYGSRRPALEISR